MTATVRHSLIRVVSLLLGLLLLIALAAMVSAITILLASQSDARAINVSGSLRMQSYRLAHALAVEANEGTIAGYLLQFEQSLTDPSLAPYLGTATRPASPLAATIFTNWAITRDRIDHSYTRHELHGAVPMMVADIDRLVVTIQRDLEAKVRELLVVQGICLALLLALAVAALLHARRRLVAPLAQLTAAARQVEQGQFNLKLPAASDDELGALSRAFGGMASELARLYGHLEAEVSTKTAALQQANATLALLYRCAERMHVSYLDEAQIRQLLAEVATACGLQRLSLLLDDERSGLPPYIEARAEAAGEQPSSPYRWPLGSSDDSLGELRAHGPLQLSTADQALLASIARLLERRLQIEILLRSDQQRLVQEERTIIARELHDSLAQTLSTIRFQLTVARHQLDSAPEQVAAQLEQIQAITANAYRHLRELLVTFRLTVSATSLESAIRTMLAELGGQISPKVSLSFAPERVSLPPARYIHLLQIVREAVLNAAKHAGGDQIAVNVSGGGSGPLLVTIDDNGGGIDPAIAAARHGHFGLDIMRERARSLGGDLSLGAPPGGGTRVILTLPPSTESAS